MKKILLVIVALLVLGGGVALYLLNASRGPEGDLGGMDDPFDFASRTGDALPGEQLPVTTAGGQTLSVPNFTKENQPPIAGPETGYQVAGSVESTYQILYFPDQSYFLVSLLSEPLGETRTAAQAELRSRLLLNDAQLCSLNLEVRTDIDVNETYAGQNLGLSFCPGATVLP